jgi:hypothetical protein
MFHLSTVDPATYVVLQKVFSLPAVKKQFALAGGTSMALQTGHRKSIDLDFFSEQVFLPQDVENLLASYDLWQYEPIRQGQQMLFCLINKIKCDFVNEPLLYDFSFCS